MKNAPKIEVQLTNKLLKKSINQNRKGPAYEKLALRNLNSFLSVGPV